MTQSNVWFLSAHGSCPRLLWGSLEIFNNKELWLWTTLPTKINLFGGLILLELGLSLRESRHIIALTPFNKLLEASSKDSTYSHEKKSVPGTKEDLVTKGRLWEVLRGLGLHSLWTPFGEVNQILQGSVSPCSVCYSGDEPKVIMYSDGAGLSTSLDCMGGFGSHRLSGDFQSTLCAAFTTYIWSWAYVHVSKNRF